MSGSGVTPLCLWDTGVTHVSSWPYLSRFVAVGASRWDLAPISRIARCSYNEVTTHPYRPASRNVSSGKPSPTANILVTPSTL
jgi:hypothetical protein